MDFIGMWKNEETDELIEFENSTHSDAYNLNYNYNHKTKEFKKTELIPINKSNDLWIIMKSEKFGKKFIFIISDSAIQIGKDSFQRIKD